MDAQDDNLLTELRRILPADGLLTAVGARFVYARDASHLRRGLPCAVALPRSSEQVAAVVDACARHAVPVTCRGAGTGLSGGAVPDTGGLVLSLARLTEVGAVDATARRVRCQAGVLNEQVSRRASSANLHFAPDPSSQAASTIGGNIAENAGGPHCLRFGVTVHHVRRLDWIDASGRSWVTGRGLAYARQIDLTALLCGSEGTLGVVTAAELNLTPDLQSLVTLLAFFPRLTDAARAVVGLLGAGLLPVAIEMVDQAMLEAIEAAFAFGFATDVEGAMIVEFGGGRRQTAADAQRAKDLLRGWGADEVRTAADQTEREAIWRCRKKAFGAIGRLAPQYISMDVVVPIGSLPTLIGRIQEIQRAHDVAIATAFHAGDGNVHPGIQFDDRDSDLVRRAHAAADAILRETLAIGGSISGEHGIGLEKRHALPWQIDAETARLLHGVKRVFDPDGVLNPGKALPVAGAKYAPLPPPPTEIAFAWDDLTVTAPAETPVSELQAAALARGFWIPVGITVARGGGLSGLGQLGSVGELIDALLPGPTLLAGGTVRDYLLELWAETGDGHLFHAGAPVAKNVVGYDLPRLLCGSGGVLARVRAATFQLRPVPDRVVAWRFDVAGDANVSSSELDRLYALLRSWDDGLAGPVCVVEIDGTAVGSVVVCAAGGDDDNECDRREQELLTVCATLGTPTERRQGAFAEAAMLVDDDFLPDWTKAAADWTLLMRQPIDRSVTELQPPGDWRRSVWQATPLGTWIPEPVSSPDQAWHGDTVRRDGTLAALPPPPAGVPQHLLAGLKHLFDPKGILPTPDWLAAALTRMAAVTQTLARERENK